MHEIILVIGKWLLRAGALLAVGGALQVAIVTAPWGWADVQTDRAETGAILFSVGFGFLMGGMVLREVPMLFDGDEGDQ